MLAVTGAAARRRRPCDPGVGPGRGATAPAGAEPGVGALNQTSSTLIPPRLCAARLRCGASAYKIKILKGLKGIVSD